MRNLLSLRGKAAEYSVDLHIQKAKFVTDTKDSFMYITISTLENDMGSLRDYTVILNGLPTPKNIKRACGKDTEAAKFIIKTLKEDACKYAIKYWNFDKDEWTSNLDRVLEQYLESEGE